jgi:predicted RNA-binding Zn-ribbon protein involved in translation (DUF1610 family)
MTQKFKAIIPPSSPKQENPFERLADIAYKFGINLNDQREAVGLPRVYQVENEPKVLKCPNCGANISVQDIKCKYCGTEFYWGKPILD